MDNFILESKTINSSELKNATNVWKECLSIIKKNVPFITYNTWFLPIKPVELNESTLKIQVPNSYFIEWIEEHFNTLINKTVFQMLGNNGKLVYIISQSDSYQPDLFSEDLDTTIKLPKEKSIKIN